MLLSEPHTVTECVGYIGRSQSRVSAHLSCLADCGYVRASRTGRTVHYSVADTRVAELVFLARSLSHENLSRLGSCPEVGDGLMTDPETAQVTD